eukprot:gb/GECG01015561.1/.p1 GENE.gb/GECG01015561.1/~~gb/GECG01015561.1/.p1  ORF type:complete len:1031 (+),score=153.84 gb/GECG01015561.1/:1-3093(+)
MTEELPCTIILRSEASSGASKEEIRKSLEGSDVQQKCDAMREMIVQMSNGANLQQLVMTVIRFCINVESHELQKLIMLYWELVPKHDESGKLLSEMILVCNAIRNSLIHPNEYLRGCTLRFLCKIRDKEILEPLIPSITQNLDHRHSYVRRNAVMAVHSIFSHFGGQLIPNAPDMIEKVLEDEGDSGTRRNAFMMLFEADQKKALKFYHQHSEKIPNFGNGFQLTLLELTRKVCRADPSQKSVFIGSIFSLLGSPSSAVSFEAATTLVAMSSAPTAARATAQTYTRLLSSVSDNNVKLILLEKLRDLKVRGQTKVLREMVMDILRCLSTPNLDIRRKALNLALELVSPKNVEQICGYLKKEIVATQSAEEGTQGRGRKGTYDKETAAYRELLIEGIHSCAVNFPSVARSVMELLMDFLTAPAADKVISFVREAVEMFEDMRDTILRKLLDVLPDIEDVVVARVTLWIIGQYCVEEQSVNDALRQIQQSIGPLPLTVTHGENHETQDESAEKSEPSEKPKKSGPKVLADGTYASQAAVESTDQIDKVESIPSLRKFLQKGDWFLASVISSTWTKLSLRLVQFRGRDEQQSKTVMVDGMMAMSAMLEAGSNPKNMLSANSEAKPADKIDQDSFERIVLCMRVLADPSASEATMDVLLDGCRKAFRGLIAYNKALEQQSSEEAMDEALQYLIAMGKNDEEEQKKQEEEEKDKDTSDLPGASLRAQLASEKARAKAAQRKREKEKAAKIAAVTAHSDDVIPIRQLRTKGSTTTEDLALDDETEIGMAVGSQEQSSSQGSSSKRVYQLTGYGDPVYVEASVSVQEYDITLHIAVMNRTDDTLTDLSVELAAVGDLKIVDRPQSHTIAPRDVLKLSSNIKVSSTEAGYIFGTLVYTRSGGHAQGNVVHLSEIHMDIMDYIRPAYVPGIKFRQMWADFEWENKVVVNTSLRNLQEYVVHIARVTNMRILTPIQALSGSANFLAANMHARSVFGEDALVNVSIENTAEGGIHGHVRIRAKTQGVALALGDRISAKQKV